MIWPQMLSCIQGDQKTTVLYQTLGKDNWKEVSRSKHRPECYSAYFWDHVMGESWDAGN